MVAGRFCSADHLLDQAFGDHFAQLVGAYDGVFVVAGSLACGLALNRFQSGNAGSVDDLFDTGFEGRFHCGAGAFEVVADDFVWIACPQAIVGGDMEEIACALHRAEHRGLVAHIAFDDFAACIGEISTGACCAHDGADIEAAFDQFSRDGRAYESRCAGDDNTVCHFIRARIFARSAPCAARTWGAASAHHRCRDAGRFRRGMCPSTSEW